MIRSTRNEIFLAYSQTLNMQVNLIVLSELN